MGKQFAGIKPIIQDHLIKTKMPFYWMSIYGAMLMSLYMKLFFIPYILAFSHFFSIFKYHVNDKIFFSLPFTFFNIFMFTSFYSHF